MADLQKQLEAFEETIRIDRKLEKAVLVEKRERILKRLSEGIAQQRTAGASIPSYRCRNQGSYAMNTGIKPLDDDYDLDVAVIFDFQGTKRPDPLTVKGWVYQAVKNHTTSVRWREPCITVFYVKEGETVYHVDLAIYAEDSSGTVLARGSENAQPDMRSWESADPEALIDAVGKRFNVAEEQAQFRRTIRYLKRWKDFNFPSQGNEAPRGIALTACAYRWFVPQLDRHPEVASGRRPNDAAALSGLVRTILAQFDWQGRIKVALPVPPGNNLFAKMSDRQLEIVREKLERLRGALAESQSDPDPHTAAQSLRKVFGPDFPVPDKVTTANKRGPGYVSSSNSG